MSARPIDDQTSSATPPALTSLLRPTDLLWLAMIVLVAVGVRILWVAYVNVDPNDGRLDDSAFYHNAGRLLASGDGYTDPWGRGLSAQWPPAYPAALAVAYKLFGLHITLAKGLNIAFAAVTVVLTYLLARRLADQRVAFVAALLLAIFPGQIFFSTLVYAEAMFAMVFMLVLLLTLEWTYRRSDARPWQLLLLGVLVGTAAMVRVEGAVLLAVLVAIWALTVRPWPTFARYGALLALGTVLAITPWTVRNAIELHEFIPLRTNAVDTVSRALDPAVEGSLVVDKTEAASVGDSLVRLTTKPWEGLSSAGRKLRAFYRNDTDAIRLLRNNQAPPGEHPLTVEAQTRWRGLANGYYFAVSSVAVLGVAWCALRRDRSCLILIVPIVGWTLFFALFPPASRYHFPLIPAISILAGAFLIYVWDGAKVAWLSLVAQRTGASASAGADSSGERNL